jgi:hypothetical protein
MSNEFGDGIERQQLSKAAAKCMWQALKQHYGQGGFLLFDKDGMGGIWFSDESRPKMEETDIPVHCFHSKYELGTLEEFMETVQNWLDQRAEDRYEAKMEELYNNAPAREEEVEDPMPMKQKSVRNSEDQER